VLTFRDLEVLGCLRRLISSGAENKTKVVTVWSIAITDRTLVLGGLKNVIIYFVFFWSVDFYQGLN
jgi:hypothetical protein